MTTFVLWGCTGDARTDRLLHSGAESPGLHKAPLDQTELPTTSAVIYLDNFDRRLEAAERRVARNGESAVARLNLSRFYYSRGMYTRDLDAIQQAIDELHECLRLEPDNADCLLMRAGAQQTLHRFAQAQSDLNRAIVLGADPREAAALQQELDWNGGHYERAAVAIRTAAAQQPSLWTLARLAQLEHDLGNFEAADEAFLRAEQSVRDTNPVPVAWLNVQRGLHELARGELAQAVVFYREAVRRAPTYVLALEHLAEALHFQGDLEESIVLYEEVIELTPAAEFLGALASVYRDANQNEKADLLRVRALRRFDESLQMYPEAMYRHAAAFFLSEGRDPQSAATLLLRSIELQPDSVGWTALARAHWANGRTEAALECVERALAMPLVSADLFWTASQVYGRLGRDEDSRKMQERVLAYNPHFKGS